MIKKAYFGLASALLLMFTATARAQANRYAQLQQSVIEDRLRQYAGNNSVREATMKKLFEEAGCGEHLKEQPVLHAAAPNVICTLPGKSDEVIIVGAHFDHVRTGDGVVDNWSGASLLPSLYQSLRSKPREHTYVFISFTDEEKGFIGSGFYAGRLTNEEASRIRAAIDIDTLGLGPTEIWVSNSDPELVRRMFEAATAANLPVSSMNVDGIGNSDGQSFQRRGIPILTLHSVTPQTFGILHTRRDNMSAIKLDDYYNSYRLIAAYLAALDSGLK